MRNASFVLALGVASLLVLGSITASQDSQSEKTEPVNDMEIAKLITDLGDGDFRMREKAMQRLREIGTPALKALREVEEKGEPETRQRATLLAKTIRLANHLPTIVNGVQFKLIVDSKWDWPERDRSTSIGLSLEITNTTASTFRLWEDLHVLFKDSKGQKLTRYRSTKTDRLARVLTLTRNQNLTVPWKATLISSQNGVVFSVTDARSNNYSTDALVKGTYHVSVVYECTGQPQDVLKGDPFWVGRAETAAVTVEIK